MACAHNQCGALMILLLEALSFLSRPLWGMFFLKVTRRGVFVISPKDGFVFDTLKKSVALKLKLKLKYLVLYRSIHSYITVMA